MQAWASRHAARRIQDGHDHLGYYRKVSAAIPPGPRGHALLGSLSDARRDPLAFVRRVSAEYGDIVHVRLATLRVFLLNHPDDIEQVLVTRHQLFVKGRSLGRARRLFGNGVLTSDGDLHARQRRLIQPAFQRPRLPAYGETMTSLATALRDEWRAGDTIDIAREMSRLTLAIAGRALFGADAGALTDGVGETLDTATSLLEVALLPLAPVVDVLPLPHVRRLRAARAALDAVLDEIIARRRRERRDGSDLLSMLLDAQDEAPAGRDSDRQLRDELTTILLAGHDTTANALAFTWYLIATHPSVEARLHAEIDSVLAGRPAAAADVSALPYTRMVFAEAMRLFPPAWLLGRVALEAYEARGHVVPAGSLVVLSPWAVHRNAAYFPAPERFDPDRWHPHRVAERPRFSYFPFGAGFRGCLGEGFAWMEGVLVLATLAQRLRFPLVDESAVPELLPAITLKPKRGIRVRVEDRLPAVVARGAEYMGERPRA
jgi:cytochrome P450